MFSPSVHYEGSEGRDSELTLKFDLLIQSVWTLGSIGRRSRSTLLILIGGTYHSHEKIVGYLVAPMGVVLFRWDSFHFTFLHLHNHPVNCQHPQNNGHSSTVGSSGRHPKRQSPSFQVPANILWDCHSSMCREVLGAGLGLHSHWGWACSSQLGDMASLLSHIPIHV